MRLVSGMPREPSLHVKLCVGSVVVQDHVHIEFFRNTLLYPAKEDEELLMAMPVVELRHDRSIEYVECGKEVNRPVPLIFLEEGRRRVGVERRTVWLLSGACIPIFSSTQTTTALSGGFMYRPTTSVTLLLNLGSVLNLKERSR